MLVERLRFLDHAGREHVVAVVGFDDVRNDAETCRATVAVNTGDKDRVNPGRTDVGIKKRPPRAANARDHETAKRMGVGKIARAVGTLSNTDEDLRVIEPTDANLADVACRKNSGV